jgi:hypothetical protein
LQNIGIHHYEFGVRIGVRQWFDIKNIFIKYFLEQSTENKNNTEYKMEEQVSHYSNYQRNFLGGTQVCDISYLPYAKWFIMRICSESEYKKAEQSNIENTVAK